MTTAPVLTLIDDDDDDDEDEDDPMIGRIFAGKYEIEALIRAGSMGAIYRAHHLTLDKTVCVKIMLDQVARNPKLAQRFQREARAGSRLDHPCSVLVLDHGKETDGTVYIAMEFIDGRDLYELIDEGPFARERIVDIIAQMLSVLASAHDVGILHRDLKPENVMVTTVRGDDGGLQERIKLCDFGIAHMADSGRTSGRRLTTRGFVMGTPDYMSPEQARAEGPDPRSDLYSVGVIMFQLLTGRLPFEADTPIGVVLKQLNDEPPRPRDLNPAADPFLEEICLRAMKKLPSERYASAREMRSALLGAGSQPAERADAAVDVDRETLEDLADLAVPSSVLPVAIRPRRKRRRAVAVMTMLAILGAGGVGLARRPHTTRLTVTRAFAIATAAAARLEVPGARMAPQGGAR